MTTDVFFHTPIGGVPYQDWTIVNYVDLDPSSGIVDFRGGNYTYNTHNAIDFTLPHFEAMDSGVPVYAALSGTVIGVEDIYPDRCSFENPCNTPANFVLIDHGNGLITEYLHLRTDSASVSVGEFVDAGQQIGEVGSSGNSTDAHLHFAVYKDGRVIEVNTPGDEFFWQSPIPYADDVVGSLDHDIIDYAPSLPELRERPETVDTFFQQPGITPHIWVHLHGIDQGDDLDFYFRQPDGSEYAHWNWSAPQIGYGWWVAAVELPDEPDVGVWEVEFQHNGSTMVTDTFTVIDDTDINDTDPEDRFRGTDNDDRMLGLAGDDRMRGRDGDDEMFGGPGDDRMRGDDGNDTLIGGSGDDVLFGNDGSDTFVLAPGGGTDTIRDFELDEGDKIGLADGLQFGQLSFEDDKILFNGEVLAEVSGFETSSFTSSDFVNVTI